MKIVSIDIGSTWTKGAIFQLENNQLKLISRAAHKTTIDNLATGFFHVLETLAPTYSSSVAKNEMKLFYSSSAKGGLAVAALGIVPDITLETAKIAAFSAGAKINHCFSYHLTEADLTEMQNSAPDILLFTGGTDGGNSDYVLSNARKLAELDLDCSIIYAGNRAVADQVSQILVEKELTVVDNILPEIDQHNPQPARDAMRDIFLAKIVKGKGLHTIIEQINEQPLPTPFAVHELTRHIRNHVQGWEEFIVLDLGGATTDVYSCHKEQLGAATVLRGLLEPEIKRTVEGDLGLRISAQAAVESNPALLANELGKYLQTQESLVEYANKVSHSPDHIGSNKLDQQKDQLIAGSCIANACARHAGRMHKVHTADGIVNVQTGRDLRSVKKLIGSGGYLANSTLFTPNDWLNKIPEDNRGRQVLLPDTITYFQDDQYLLPLLGNIAQQYPEAAAQAAIDSLSVNNHLPDAINAEIKNYQPEPVNQASL